MKRISKLLKVVGITTLLIFTSLAWGVNDADKQPKKPPEWRVKGCMAAISDPDPQIVAATLIEGYCDEIWPFIQQNQVHRIAELLDNEDGDVRNAAFNVLIKLKATDQIVKLLKNMDYSMRLMAIRALDQLKATDQIPVIAQWLNDEEYYVRLASMEALIALGAKGQAPTIAQSLKSTDNDLRRIALEALAKLKATDQIPAISKLLEDDDFQIRMTTMEVLGKLGAKNQVSTIVHFLEDENQHIRTRALETLGKLDATDQVPVIVKFLENLEYGELYERRIVIKVLGELGAKNQAATIAQSLKSTNRFLRKIALEALAKLEATDQIPAISKLLEDEIYSIRLKAMELIVKWGEKDQISAVINQLKDVGSSRFWSAPGVLVKLKETNQASTIAKWLKDEQYEVRQTAIDTLGALEAKDQISVIIEWLKDERSYVRKAVIQALVKLGAKDQSPIIAERLKDIDFEVRKMAIKALIKLDAKDQASKIVSLLKEKNWNLRREAIIALGELGAIEFTPAIAEQLKDKEKYVRDMATYVLGKLGARDLAPTLSAWIRDKDDDVRLAVLKSLAILEAKGQVPIIAEQLKDENENVRETAINALVALEAIEEVPVIAKHLTDGSAFVRRTAIEALGKLGATDQTSAIAERLEDGDYFVRRKAIYWLGKMGVKNQASAIAERIRDRNDGVRRVAVYWLGVLGAKDQAPAIAELLETEEDRVRLTAIKALGTLGATDQAPTIAKLLLDKNSKVCWAATNVLLEMEGNDVATIAAVLENALNEPSYREEMRALALVLAGGEDKVKTALRWLIDRPSFDKIKSDSTIVNEALSAYLYFWKDRSAQSFQLRKNMSGNIARLVKEAGPVGLDNTSLRKVRDIVQDDFPFSNDIFGQVLASQEKAKTLLMASGGLAGHLVFWILLIMAYPHYRPVQAIFFWNPWVRKLLGLGYVGFLLTWSPPLRRRLLSPFKEILLSDARLDEFDEAAYFCDSLVKSRTNQTLRPIIDELTILHGLVLLEGDSGLGKTSFIRRHLKQSRRLAVYLPSQRCGQGVLSAIQSKLIGYAEDERFLKSLIYSGALDVYIDGLNETSPEIHALIKQFAEDFFHANLLLSTQPMKWEPPVSVRVLELQPLDESRIKAFLLSRHLLEDARLGQSEYELAVTSFLDLHFGEAVSEQSTCHMHAVLSNPLDLSVIAEMLARGDIPDVFNLQQQFFEHMAMNYAEENCGQAFPLKEFAESVYGLRRQNEWMTSLRGAWLTELDYLAKYRLMIRRDVDAGNAADKQVVTRWYFRHDKIQDFFLSEAFFDKRDRQNEHMNDARFRGVYFYLASRLPLEQALNLRDRLTEYAADHSDHTVSDAYIKTLRTRPDWISFSN